MPLQVDDFNWHAFSPKRGITAALVVVLMLGLGVLFGGLGIVITYSALLTLIATLGWEHTARAPVASAFAIGGALLSLVATLVVVFDQIWFTVTFVFLITWVCGFLFAAGPPAAQTGLQINVWLLIVLSVSDRLTLGEMALGFLFGSGVVATVLWLLRGRIAPAPDQPIPLRGETPLNATGTAMQRELSPQSPVLHFAFLRAAAVALAYWIGTVFFAAHPFWAAIATLVIIRPAFDQTLARGIARSIGTALGAIVGAWLFTLINAPLLQLAMIAVIAFGMGATLGINYAIFTTFLTFALIWFTGLLGGDPFITGQERTLETVIGLGLALAAITLLQIYTSKPLPAET